MRSEQIPELVGYVCLTIAVIFGAGFAYAGCKTESLKETERFRYEAEKYKACVEVHPPLECKQ